MLPFLQARVNEVIKQAFLILRAQAWHTRSDKVSDLSISKPIFEQISAYSRENKASDGIVLILTVAFPCEYISRHVLIAWDNAIHKTYHQLVKNVIGGGNKKYRSPGQAVPRGFAARCLSPRLLFAASPLIFATLQVCHRAQIVFAALQLCSFVAFSARSDCLNRRATQARL